MAFSFEPFLAISAGHFMAVSAGPEHYDPDDPRCEREAAAATVAEMLNKQILTLDPKAIRL